MIYNCIEFLEAYGVKPTNAEAAHWLIISFARRWPHLIKTWVGTDGRRLVEVR